MYGIREKDEKIIAAVLADVQKSVTCEIGIGGSIAQRALSPEIARLIEGRRLHDIDLLLLSYTDNPISMSMLKKHFWIMEITNPNGGWYFGLRHKSSFKWVDLFTPAYTRAMQQISMTGSAYAAESLESQILYLAHDILRRTKDEIPILKKWISKLDSLLHVPEIDHARLEQEFDVHKTYFLSVLPPNNESPTTVSAYVTLALKQKSRSTLKGLLFYFQWYLRANRQ